MTTVPFAHVANPAPGSACACARCQDNAKRGIHLLQDAPWVDRVITMRCARRLADSLEDIAREAQDATGEDLARLEKVFAGRLVALDSLIRGCP